MPLRRLEHTFLANEDASLGKAFLDARRPVTLQGLLEPRELLANRKQFALAVHQAAARVRKSPCHDLLAVGERRVVF